MIEYLEGAKPEEIFVSRWGTSTWVCAHGETRSNNNDFHFGLLYADGIYQTCILVNTSILGNLPVENSIRSWPSEPTLEEIIQWYQEKYCLLKKGPKPESYCFAGSKGLERNAQYVGAEPRGMDGDSSPVSECSQ